MVRHLLVSCGMLLFFYSGIVAQEVGKGRFTHRLGAEIRPGYVFPTNSFLRGFNREQSPIRNSFDAHIKYSFQFPPDSPAGRIFGNVYQGFGLGKFVFGNPSELGNPMAFYLFQGARITGISPRVSFNYEWNFGLSWGWKPYESWYNRFNVVIGSRINAYINADFYFKWVLSSYFDLTSGVSLTHFSNGNTEFPNAGLNMAGFNVGLVYYFNRTGFSMRSCSPSPVPPFPAHFSYDCVLFGSWKRKGYVDGDKFVPSPLAYKVIGLNFAAMYNFGYKFRAGISLDGVYDASANVFTRKDYYALGVQHFVKPPLNAQTALGISGRAEYVMPCFIVGIGVGSNVLHRGGDLKAFYQILALKVAVARNFFLHVGYNLQEFRNPNHLMLGIGYRFNNRYPVVYR